MPGRTTRNTAAVAAAVAVLVGACGDSGTTTTAPTVTAPAATLAATTTTATVAADPDAFVVAKAQAAADTLPADWAVEIQNEFGQAAGDRFVFTPCLDDDDFDLAELDEVSLAVREADFSAPQVTGALPAPNGQVEVRIFKSPDDAEFAFAALEKALGDDAGRTCLGAATVDIISEGTPEGTTFDVSVEEMVLPGADVGARLLFTFDATGITGTVYVDFVAARVDAWTVFATFQTFDEPFPADLAATLFAAALLG